MDGATYPWQAGYGDTNLTSGNKLISLPLVPWTARGGLPVAFALSHNSQATATAELGPKWTASYDIFLSSPASGQLAVTWGDGSGYTFTLGGVYTPPAGIRDALAQNADGTVGVVPDPTGRTLTYAYTSRNQLASASEAAGTASCGYDAGGNETGITNENGTTAAKVNDNAGRLSSVTSQSPSGTTLSRCAILKDGLT